MKIVPIKISGKVLYENRHLFTDDVHYNSLIISNLINKKIELLDIETYKQIDEDSKMEIYNLNIFYNFILDNTGLFSICLFKTDSFGVVERLENDIKFYSWQDLYKKYKNLLAVVFDVLTIV